MQYDGQNVQLPNNKNLGIKKVAHNQKPKQTLTLQALWQQSGITPNAAQQEAIFHTEKPLLIIAGPGSGKTFTLVERVVHLVTDQGVAPEHILLVTFTDKAAQELTTRVSNRLNALGVKVNLNEMYLGTFHSICLRWLDEYRDYTRLKRNYTLMDQFDQQYFLYRGMKEYTELDDIGEVIGASEKVSAWHKSEELLKRINQCSEEVLNADTLMQADDSAIVALGKCYALYQQQLEAENALDFSTIQLEALKLLRNQPDVLAQLQQKITYLMVDEYQDTNTIQEQLLFTLAGDNTAPNLCVVGDDDQGLYRFRGATIRNILEFKQRFPSGVCKQVSLTTNYRSHPDIIHFYNHWMDGQVWDVGDKHFRFPKRIQARDDEFPDTATAVRLSKPTAEGWHEEVLNLLHQLKDSGQLNDWNQVAFLFKSVKNPKATALARHLEHNGIAVYSPRANQFFEREEIRLMIGALIFLFPQFPQVRQWQANASLKIWDYYDQDCFSPFAHALRQAENAPLRRWAASIAKQHHVLTRNTDHTFSGLFYQLLSFPLFSRYLRVEQMGSIKDSRPMRNLAIFSQLLGKFEYLHHISVLTPKFLDKNIRDLFNQFLRFLKDGGIFEYEDQAEYAPSGCVSFLTIHQSKGLEFPLVFVGSLEATPRKQHTPLDEVLQDYFSKAPFEPIEHTKFFDFRRLYYTAYSRAQNLLVLTCQEIEGRGRTPSKHFDEYFYQLPDWQHPDLRLVDIQLDSIKPSSLKREYAFTSHITLFENCAEQYRFFKALEFAPVRTNPILFGTLVHQTIEDIHKTVLRGDSDKLSETQIEHWFDSNYHYLTKRERVYLNDTIKNVALQHVLRYYQRQNGDWSRIREAEVDVSLVKDEYILKGSIDLICGANDTVELVDFKSEKKLDVNEPKDREKLDRYRRQLEVYAHIVEQRMSVEVSKTHLYYTSEQSGNPYITWDKDSRAIERTIAKFDQVVQRIEQQDFSVEERPVKLCRECDLKGYCDEK